MFDLIVLVVLLVVSYFTGTRIEKKHFESIRLREKNLLRLPRISQTKQPASSARDIRMVSGSAVIAADFFRYYLSSLISLFGGNIGVMESLLDRARREAVLRMLESCSDADYISGVRYETSALNEESGQRSLPKVEVLVYGTAIYLNKDAVPAS